MLAMARIVLAAALAVTARAAMPLTSANALFGTSIKNGPLPANTETPTFQHNCTAPPCIITQIHVPSIYPGSGCPWDWENGRLRFYIDGETVPSIDITLLELANVGRLAASGDSAGDGSPFSSELFGKNAQSGGVFSTVRIPFTTSFYSTIQGPASCGSQMTFWFVIRGVEAAPVTLGTDFVLPDQARLTLWRNVNVTTQPREYITLAAVPPSSSGAFLITMMDTQSGDYNFLEACFRLYLNGATTPTIFLSSGTEDFFLSASYFDEGRFLNTQSGVSFLTNGVGVSSYKVHTRDVLPFFGGANFTWRNNEDSSCPNAWPIPAVDNPIPVKPRNGTVGTGPATMSTLVWGYTWPANASQLTYTSAWHRLAAARRAHGSRAALGRLDRLLQSEQLDLMLGLRARALLRGGDDMLRDVFDAFESASDAVLARKVAAVMATRP